MHRSGGTAMKRTTRTMMSMAIAALLAASLARPVTAEEPGNGAARLQLVEATVSQLERAMQTGLLTAEQLVRLYRTRIDAYDKAGPGVNAFLYLNPNAEATARELDARRHPGLAPSPLYGI